MILLTSNIVIQNNPLIYPIIGVFVVEKQVLGLHLQYTSQNMSGLSQNTEKCQVIAK